MAAHGIIKADNRIVPPAKSLVEALSGRELEVLHHQLDINALWHKEASISNSIGEIVLHICEHIKRNSIRFSNQKHPGLTKGIEDHFPDIKIFPNELIKVSNDTFGDFNEVMQRVLNNPLEKIDMHSLYHLVEHTGLKPKNFERFKSLS